MNSKMNDVINTLTQELYALIEAKTVEEALYGLIAYLHNGLIILNEVLLHFDSK